jgi:hypothetical protein
MISRLLIAHTVVVMVLFVAQGDGSGTTPTPPTPDTVVDSSGCPVEDEAYCDVATGAANAFAAGDDEALLELSRVDTIDCDEVAAEYFPDCEPGGVLQGYGLSDPHFLVRFVDENAYSDHLDTITGRVDLSFSDDLGDGSLRIIGVGTCGPDVPGRRTYHLAWTIAYRQGDGDTERVLGSFEFTFADDWRIALTYVGTLAEWRTEQADPLHQAFCEAGRTPWAS